MMAVTGLALVLLAGLALVLGALWIWPRGGPPPSAPDTGSASRVAVRVSEPTLTPTPTGIPATPSQAVTRTPAATATAPGPLWAQGTLILSQRVGDRAGLFRLDLSGVREPVALSASTEHDLMGAVLSPGGNHIAYEIYPHQLAVLDLRAPDTGPTLLATCRAPSWSPDGAQLLCQATADAGRVFRIWDVASASLVREWPAPAGAVFPTWSPRGDRWIYALLTDNVMQPVMQTADGVAAQALPGRGSENYAPAWSPDGQWIAYQSNADSGQSEIWIMHPDGRDARRLTTTPGGWSRAPAWSPDGRWLAFVSSRAGSLGDDYGEVFVVPVDGGEAVQLTTTGGRIYDWCVSWGRLGP